MDRQTLINPYSFELFLSLRENMDFYLSDPFSQRAFRYFPPSEIKEEVERAACEISKKVSNRWRKLVEGMASWEKRPSVLHYDPYGNRIDEIIRPMEVEILEKEVFSEALFSKRTHPWVRLVKLFLIYQLGESCIACPLVCTEGLIALLENYADTSELKRILVHCRDGIDGDFGIGAQYLSEIQGGSDVPANRVTAINENGQWRIYGDKFFCSAAHADYAVVTARPQNSSSIATFVVPSWEGLEGKFKRKRNNFTINRLKWKMGTVELPTAEITFNGSIAYPVGPLEKGLANVVGIVLAHSRMTVGLSSAAFMIRGVREAKLYASFREAFGTKIENFPLVARTLEEIDHIAKRSLAGVLKLYSLFFDLPGGFQGGLKPSKKFFDLWRRRFLVRELVMLQKITAAYDAPDVLRKAISIFGGHGVMEDFSALPRLFRDSIVNELWEGPRNVLLTQIYRDLQRVKDFYSPINFCKDLLGNGLGEELGKECMELLEKDVLSSREECKLWDEFCEKLCWAFQEQALEEVYASK
ncbi:MAG: acyl-CoA dehydrogenase family protein [Syntrophobacterales bacterium]|nr:acyl-CoA dehydrogenase family protein [Syntrophobacterales bacterium]